MNTVTQCGNECKAEARKFFDKNDAWVNDPKISSELSEALFKRIMSGDVERARTILLAVAPIGYFPHIIGGGIPLFEFAKFYGVTEKYLVSVLKRHELNVTNYPHDVLCTDIWEIERMVGFKQRDLRGEMRAFYRDKPQGDLYDRSVSGSTLRYLVEDRNGEMILVEASEKKKITLYSPRIVLAAALLIHCPRCQKGESNLGRAILSIKRSSYRFEEEKKEENAEPVSQQNAKINGNGEIVLSPELFTGMIKVAVREAVSEVISKLENMHPTELPSTQGRPKGKVAKLTKPANWEATVREYRSGKITAKQAGAQTGMCEASFRNYANGKRYF